MLVGIVTQYRTESHDSRGEIQFDGALEAHLLYDSGRS